MLFFSLFSSYAILASFTFLFCKIARLKFIYAAPSVTSILLILLTISASLGVLYHVTALIFSLGGMLTTYLCFKKFRSLKFIAREYAAEVIFLLLIIILYFLYVQGAILTVWDDLSLWGMLSKELILHHQFETSNMPTALLNNLAHYPRGPAVYHYFTLFLSGYSEAGVLTAHLVLHVIFLMPLIANRSSLLTIFFILITFAALALYTSAFRSIYNDSSTGIIFSSILALSLLEKNQTSFFILILPICAFLPLFREIGFILSLLAAVFIIYQQMLIKEQLRTSPRGYYLGYFLLILLPTISYFGWQTYFKAHHDFFGRKEHSISNLIYLFQHFDEDKFKLLQSYIRSVLIFSFKEAAIFTYVILGACFYLLKKRPAIYLEQFKKSLQALFFCFIVYCLWRLYLYYFNFSMEEALRGASLRRYLGIFCISFIVVACAIVKSSSIFSLNKNQIRLLSLLSLISFLIIMHRSILTINFHTPATQIYNSQVEKVKEYIKRDWIVEYDFSGKKSELECLEFNYKLAPYTSKEAFYDCSQFQIPIEEEIYEPRPINTSLEERPKPLTQGCKIIFYPFKLKLIENCD